MDVSRALIVASRLLIKRISSSTYSSTIAKPWLFSTFRSFGVNKSLQQDSKKTASRANDLSFETDELSNALVEPSERPTWAGSRMKYTTKLEINLPETMENRQVFRILDGRGRVAPNPEMEKLVNELQPELLHKMYRTMCTLVRMDTILYEAQRQGRISFYMTSIGEEGAQIGSAAALDPKDLIYAQYREPGVLMWRGMEPEKLMDQCYGNTSDAGKGRQMPVHYGSRAHNYVTISSPLGTQIPQASGSAYVYKRMHSGLCVACYFGEGAASEGDAHSAFNLASTLDAPALFICRNNGYAISTPVTEQYRGDGIASRAPGYGMASVRVDGNDVLGTYAAVRAARALCVEHSRPVLIEAMTYRVGHHSTSDDSSVYRKRDEVKHWTSEDNPVSRLRLFLESRSLWDEAREKQMDAEIRKGLLEAFQRAERRPRPSPTLLFTDVYGDKQMPVRLRRQHDEMRAHVAAHAAHYPISPHGPHIPFQEDPEAKST